MKVKTVNRRLRELTPERREEMRLDLLERRSKLTVAYQLGYYVGLEIVHRFLPTISVDAIHTNTNISVTCAEGDENRRLSDAWHSKYSDDENSGKAEWEALRTHHEMLEDKYLPKTVDCHFQLLNITAEHMSEFKDGVRVALWDCDACSYMIGKNEDIDVIADNEGWFTNIILKR